MSPRKKTSQSRLDQQQALKVKRRMVKPGFPYPFKFKTKEEVDEYLGGDKIVCLLCGKEMLKLNGHIQRIHNIECDAYREMFGIPWMKSLQSQTTRDRHSTAMLRNRAKGLYQNGTAEFLTEIARRKKRTVCQITKDEFASHRDEYRKAHPKLSDEEVERRYRERTGYLPRGSDESTERMRNRPRTQAQIAVCNSFGDRWRGKSKPSGQRKKMSISNKKYHARKKAEQQKSGGETL